jgi:hypothetical protein
MFAADGSTITPITLPRWVERIALPEYPAMPIPGYILLGLGLLLLLIGYFTRIAKISSLLTSLSLLAYYPLAYVFYWFLYRYDEPARALREPTKFEAFLLRYPHAIEWVILGVCAFLGLVFAGLTVWLTLRKHRRTRVKETVSADNPFLEQPAVARPQTVPARPTAPRPAAPAPAPQARKVPKKPPAPPASDNPFKFT